jgi:DNA mismatch endonuclease, patch repair protein
MKAPSFSDLRSASPSASVAKQKNRSADTAHEKMLRKVLWSRGHRYRKNFAKLPGKPDIVFTKARVVVFCDGDFWHGRNWGRLSSHLRSGSNAAYWCQKIRANMLRDRSTTRLLEKTHWCVVRLWESNIRADPERAANAVERILMNRRDRSH